jgi:beta-glucanase (GH16 family)
MKNRLRSTSDAPLPRGYNAAPRRAPGDQGEPSQVRKLNSWMVGLVCGLLVVAACASATPSAEASTRHATAATKMATGNTPLIKQQTLLTTFDEEFGGTSLDTSRWVALNRPGDGGNNEKECYIPSNAAVGGGYLVLTTKVDSSCSGFSYTSSMVQWKSDSFLYGTLDIRAKLAGGKGTWPSLWLLGTNCQQTNITTPNNVPPCNWPVTGSDEIDIAEVMLANLTHVNQQIHSNSANPGCTATTSDVSVNWHTYTLDWQPGKMVWKIDGTTTCTITSNVPTTSMFLIMNTAVGGMGGTIDNNTLPQTHSIDYVRLNSNGTGVTVNASPPASTEGAALSGTVATFSGATCPCTASIDWGDSSSSAGTISGTSVSGSHTYAEEGSKTVKVTVTDSASHSGSGSASASVADAALSGSGVSTTATQGTLFSGQVASFSDADPGGLPSDYTASINWGDSTTSAGIVSAGIVSGSHTYTVAGTMHPKITITDSGGASTAPTGTITVAPAPPPPGPCTSAGLSASPAPPSLPGTTVKLSATAAGCLSPRYEFWLGYPDGSWVMKQPFGTSSSWSWDTSGFPAGNYTVHVWANQSGDPTNTWEAYGSVDNYRLSAPATCLTASLSPSSTSVTVGTTVNLSASSSGCPNPQYQFFVGYPDGNWVLSQGWGGSSFSWSTAGLASGAYLIHVWANQLGDPTNTWEAYGSSSVTLIRIGCTSAALSPLNPSVSAGATVTLTASSSGCPKPQYEFWVGYPDGSWVLSQVWGGSTFNWTTSGLALGVYTIHVWANNQGDSTATWEAYGSDLVTLTGCTSASLSPASGSMPAGGKLTFTASATGCATPIYQFWLMYPDGSWHMVRAFSTTSTWLWDSSGLPKGTYVVHVWANAQGGNTDSWQAYGSATYTLT